jgi:RNA polymerase sigma-70 factor (ECF subfamily)
MPNHKIDPNKWIDLYSDYLFNYTITRVNDRVIAQDLVSETFLAGLKSMKNFKGEASERTWLVSILKRKVIDYYRKINSNKGKAEVRMSYI